MTVSFAILLFLAYLAVAGVAGTSSQFHKSDAAGQGLAQGFALVLSVFLWMVVGILLLVSSSRNAFSAFAGLAFMVLYIGGVAGHFTALRILQELPAKDKLEILLRLVLMASPCVLVLYCVWNFFSGLRGLVSATLVNWIAVVCLLVLEVVPWVVRGPVYAAAAVRVQASRDAWGQEKVNTKDP